MSINKITLPVSGAVITIRRQPMDVMLAAQARAREIHAAPPVPKVQDEVAPGQFVSRDDYNNPDYINAIREYEQKWTTSFGDMLLNILARTCIVKDEHYQRYLTDAQEIQATYREMGLTVPDDINMVAIMYVIAVSAEDVNYMMLEVFGKTMPNEGQVAMRAAMFQGEVQAP
jgi:hypothetical protein